MLGPTPPPAADVNATLAEWDSVPLFMRSLPDEDSQDAKLAALQSLAFEGTPDEIALNFKEQGNDYFKGKRYREALGFYTQGVDASPEDRGLLEALLCNRAACNLELENFGSVLRDCSKALTMNPKSSKAYYRSAMALHTLERYGEGLDCCRRCLLVDPENMAMIDLQGRIEKAQEAKDRREREKEERLRKERLERARMKKALKERNILVATGEGSEHSGMYQPEFDKEDPTGQTLIVPVVLLYPQHATSDVIPSFVEDTTFSAHLARMFPPDAQSPLWDEKREYTTSSVVVYAFTRKKRLFKVGKKMTLQDVFRRAAPTNANEEDGLEMTEGCLAFAVLPRGSEEDKWVAQFKRERG